MSDRFEAFLGFLQRALIVPLGRLLAAVDGGERWMDVEGACECGEDGGHREPRAAMPGVDAERAHRTSCRSEQPAEGHDERPLQEAEESLEAIRHD